MRIGYGRVSTRGQHPDSQRDALAMANCQEIFIDHASGKLASCPELDKALLRLRSGDQLVVTKLDRLGHSLRHLRSLVDKLEDEGIDLIVLDQGIDTTTPGGRMFFPILGAIVEFEHALISERTRDGLATARAQGKKGGQKPKLTTGQLTQVRAMYDQVDEAGNPAFTVAQIAHEFGVTRATIYRHLDNEKDT